ncbi:MAG: MFS transporter [Chloroflexi bacterium]|nr:MFS transporter [Chloroflexota bacterium]MCY3937285.1 MFS transporter [Chloroflexota bacterium]
MRPLFADRWFIVFLSILFFNGAISGPLSTFLSIYVADGLAQDQKLAANLRTVSLLFMAIFALVGGITSDSVGSRSTLFVGVLGTAAGAAIFLTESPPLLFLLAAAEGAGLGMLSTGSQSYLLNATWVGRVGTATGLYFAGRSLGSVAGDPIGGAILQWWDFRTLGLIALVALIPVLAAVFALPRSGAGERGKTADLRTVLAGITDIVRRSEVLSLSLMQYFRTTFWGAAGLALPFLLKRLTDSNLTVGWFSAVALAAGVMAVLVMGPVSDRIGRRFAVLAAVSAMLSGSVLLAVFAGSAAGILAGGIVASIGAWMLSGQVPPLVKQIERGGEAGRMMSTVSVPWALGNLTGAQLHGLLTESSPTGLFVVTSAVLLIALLAAYRVVHSHPVQIASN